MYCLSLQNYQYIINLFLTLPYKYMLGACVVLARLLVMDLTYAVAKYFR